MPWKLHDSTLEIEVCLFGLAFLGLGTVLVGSGEEVRLQCSRFNQFENRCQLVSGKLIGTKIVQEFSNVEGAVVEQDIYEPRPGKKSIVDSRINLIIQKQRVLLNDDRTSRFDQEAVEQINSFVNHQNQSLARVLITQSLHVAYIGIGLILFGVSLIKKSIKLMQK